MYVLMRAFMRFMVSVFLVGGLFRIIGAENVPRSGPLIVCPNHSATLDPPLVPAYLPRGDTWSMAKSEYFKRRWKRWLFRAYQSFPVVRHTADRAALRRAFDLLKAGEVVIIYPEGTRIESGKLAQPEPGAGFIAQKSGCPVLPVALRGTRECLPKGAKWPRRVPVSITFGKPFTVATRRADGTKISHDDASAAIMVAIAELLPPDQRGEFSDLEAIKGRLGGVAVPA
jgi:1-acyl-sn-glycerol-3-phosphate acyltransferase